MLIELIESMIAWEKKTKKYKRSDVNNNSDIS
jgi:hypothetical protein